ncbi:hypothetical protein RND81_04G243000 [Saponaria officinalis]|uniref:Uncharacterized protein n=1 Tax=Saponaria officinalis TaxID=3572 RepID=A0AAW1LPD4_SAPOF
MQHNCCITSSFIRIQPGHGMSHMKYIAWEIWMTTLHSITKAALSVISLCWQSLCRFLKLTVSPKYMSHERYQDATSDCDTLLKPDTTVSAVCSSSRAKQETLALSSFPGSITVQSAHMLVQRSQKAQVTALMHLYFCNA